LVFVIISATIYTYMADFPIELTNAQDDVTDVIARHINNLEAKVGVDDSSVTSSLDFLTKSIHYNVKRYGAKGDGTTDDTTAVQDALTAGAGGTVFFPKGNYLVSNSLTIPADTTIFGYGARVFDTVTQRSLIIVDTGVSIYGLEVEGAGNTGYDTSGRLLSCTGTVSTYKSNIKLIDCYLHDVGRSAIEFEFVENVFIDRCRIENCGFAGFRGTAVTSNKITNSSFKGFTPGASGNVYAIAFTRREISSDLDVYPRSKNCTVNGCVIEDATIWHGLDTHAGEHIVFSNNIIRGCSMGVSLVKTQDGGGGDNDHASQNCTVVGNTIYGLGTGGGIVVSGAGSGVVGTVTEYATGNVIANNTLIECGEEGNAAQGTIHIVNTKGTVISGNTLKDCYSIGIAITSDNDGYSITGNVIVDVQDDTTGACPAIKILSEYNVGTISGNTLRRINDALNTYVMERGIYISTSDNNETVIGPNYNNCVTEFAGVGGSDVWFGHYSDGLKLYIINTTPEGAITAEVGSMCINTNGGAGTTLYIKESGSGNTGWAGV